MKKLKKIFGGIDLTYKHVIIGAIIIGVLIGLLNSIPFLNDTTITDFASVYGLWIICGIFIIMNSKSNKDSALKCFLFFLISQPIIYLVEVPFNDLGWGLFRYYKFWFKLTILCLPMGYLGYYIKKDKWYGLLLLTPMIILSTSEILQSLSGLVYSFPRHLINLIMVCSSSILFPLIIFKNKKVKYIGLSISILSILVFTILTFTYNMDYETTLKCTSENLYYDETYKAYLENERYGDLDIVYYEELESYCIDAKFHKKGNTKLIIEDPNGNKKEFDLTIGRDTYSFNNK